MVEKTTTKRHVAVCVEAVTSAARPCRVIMDTVPSFTSIDISRRARVSSPSVASLVNITNHSIDKLSQSRRWVSVCGITAPAVVIVTSSDLFIVQVRHKIDRYLGMCHLRTLAYFRCFRDIVYHNIQIFWTSLGQAAVNWICL